MVNSWKFMLKKNQLMCFLFDMNFHEYSMNFHKLLYKPFLFFYLIFILILDFRQYAKTMIFSRLRREGLARRPKGKSNHSNRYKSNKYILKDLNRFVRFLSHSDTHYCMLKRNLKF